MTESSLRESAKAKAKRNAPLATPSGYKKEKAEQIAEAMNVVLADVFALYLKTKNFHWHLSGPHFRDYHLMFDDQADELLAMTDVIAERVRKVGGNTLRSVGHISRLQRIPDNDAAYVEPLDMLGELAEDNKTLASHLREAHAICGECGDIATVSVIEDWIDDAERRTWFLFEAGRPELSSGH